MDSSIKQQRVNSFNNVALLLSGFPLKNSYDFQRFSLELK